MKQIPASAQMLARQILSHEAGSGESTDPDILMDAIDRIEAQLRKRLAELIGLLGYTTLFARALRQAQGENPALEHITVDMEEGGLRGMRDFLKVAGESTTDPHTVEIGLTSILAHFLALLTTFIGEDLGFRLVREGWPGLGHTPVAFGEI